MTDSAQTPAATRRSNLLSRMRKGLVSQPTSMPTPIQQPTVQPPAASQDDSLAVLDRVLTQVEQVQTPPEPEATVPVQSMSQPATQPLDQSASIPTQAAPAVPQAVAQATDTLNNPAFAGGMAKEQLETGVTPDQQSSDTEQTVGAIPIETEVSPELSPEVEAYLQKVEEHKNQIPNEIVLADDGQTISTRPHIAQPVIVLPVTEEEEAAGIKKNPTFSFRWLVEWSRKLMKKFTGKVVYREP